MNPIIVVDQLIKRYKKAEENAVDDISFNVHEGEFFSLLGPNGAGKTTTISILTTTLAKTSGKITIADFDIDSQPASVRRMIGVIFQKPSLDQNLTAEENVRFHASLYGIYPFRPVFSFMDSTYKKKVFELAEILGIKKEIFHPVKSFSGGMKRKLEIVRSLLHNPKILFMDEPTSGLDPVSRNNLWEYLTSIRRKDHLTIFLTTHYLEEAEDSDRVCVIDHGKIVSLGTPSALKKTLIQEYILLDAHDHESLLKQLQTQEVKFEDGHPVKVFVKKDDIQKLIHKITIPLSVITLHTPSLEDAYVELISRYERT